MIKELEQDILMQLTRISPELNSKILYFGMLKRKLNLKEPKTFNEKLMWLKLNTYKKIES